MQQNKYDAGGCIQAFGMIALTLFMGIARLGDNFVGCARHADNFVIPASRGMDDAVHAPRYFPSVSHADDAFPTAVVVEEPMKLIKSTKVEGKVVDKSYRIDLDELKRDSLSIDD
jgi:hypothetical protein